MLRKCLLFNVQCSSDWLDVSDEESDQELPILTPQDIIIKAKTLKSADLLHSCTVWEMLGYDLFM
jgi:hypothetical protein